MKPKIGITCGEIQNLEEPWSPVTYGQSHTYTDAIIHAAGVPFILPFAEDESVLRELYDMCDGILFAGGNDVDPVLYGEQPLPETAEVSTARDTQELQLLKWALADDKPILAICRGMQILNVARGGTLYQDIASQLPDASDHAESTKRKDRTYIAHQISLAPDSHIARITAKTILDANTHHHQAVRELGDGIKATGWAADGIIEAMELPGQTFALAVQSHPEALEMAMPEWQALFRAFVQAS